MDDLDKRYYKIREVAELLDLPASTLRFWEQNFTILKPKRTTHRARLYTPADIEILRMIRYLVKDKGLKLDAAEAEIRRNRTGVSRRFEAIERLRDIRAGLLAIQDALDARLRRPKAAPAAADTAPAAPTVAEQADAKPAAPAAATHDEPVVATPAESSATPLVATSPTPPADTPKEAPLSEPQTKKRRSKKRIDPDLPTLF